MEAIKLQPRNEEAERIVLGTIMSNRNSLDDVRDLLKPETFYDPFHQAIYKAIMEIDGKGESPDFIMVKEQLDRNNVQYKLADFMKIASSQSYDIYQHAAIVHDKYIRRRFDLIGNYLINNCYNEENDIVDVVSEVMGKIDSLFSDDGGKNISTLRECVQDIYDLISRNINGEQASQGFPTGLQEYDSRTGGLQKSDLIIIAADTSQGKTSLAIKIAMSAGCPIAFYSMEMTKQQVVSRMISMGSGVSSKSIQFRPLSDAELSKVDASVSKMLNNEIYFDDRSTSNIDNIISSIRSLKTRYGIQGVILDYLQILNVNMKGASKEQQMGDVARRLKNLAKELDIWIVALSQISRDNMNPVPTLSRLRGSGQIAEAADIVMLIYRAQIYGKAYPDPFSKVNTRDTAMINVAKGRNIGTFKFIVGFDGNTTNFYNLSEILDNPIEETPF